MPLYKSASGPVISLYQGLSCFDLSLLFLHVVLGKSFNPKFISNLKRIVINKNKIMVIFFAPRKIADNARSAIACYLQNFINSSSNN